MPGPVSGREGLGELGAFAVWEELLDGKTQSIDLDRHRSHLSCVLPVQRSYKAS